MGSTGGGFGSGMSEKGRQGPSFGKGRERGGGEEEGVDELSSLLGGVEGSSRGGRGGGVGTVRRENKPRRTVKWSDRYGDKLVEVVEFEPSDSSDSEGESLMDSCICSVM